MPDSPDRRARLAACITAAALILGGGFAVVVGATGMFGTRGPSSPISTPARVNSTVDRANISGLIYLTAGH